MKGMHMKKRWLETVASIGICETAGVAAGYFSASGATTWYTQLKKPPFTPPAGVFGPVWTLLYALMGVAAGEIWHRRRQKGAQRALWVFALQLLLNLLWSFIFFTWQRPWLALVELGALWIAILATMALFWPISRRAALLLVPYFAWVSLAGVLNASIAWLNR